MRRSCDAGFDIGGTRIKFGLADRQGRLVLKDQAETPPSMKGLLSGLAGIWEEMTRRSPGPIRSCGFGFPGFYSLKSRRVLHSPNFPALDGFNLFPALRKIIDVPFVVDNDANLAAFGEFLHGAGKGARSLVFLTVGTGVGAGIILDGSLWRGSGGFAGELGHITVNPEGEVCNCGARGCLETEVSASKIVDNYLQFGGSEPRRPLTSEDVHLRAKRGDKAALESLARCGYYLGIGLGIVVNLLNPERILIGGGVVSAGKYLLGPALAEARKRSHPVSFSCASIGPASLGNDAGLIGAAALAGRSAGAGALKPTSSSRSWNTLTSPDEKTITGSRRSRQRRPS
jgi:glucokinase